MAKRKLYKTVIEVTVLSEEAPVPDGCGLDHIHNQITDGDWSGHIEIKKTERLNCTEMAYALQAQGSDPSFFQLRTPK